MPKKNNTTKKLAQTVIVEVSEAEYQADLAQGLQPDETLQPGRHTFQRGGFLGRYVQVQVALATTTRGADFDDADHCWVDP